MNNDIRITVKTATGAAEADLAKLAKKVDALDGKTGRYSKSSKKMNDHMRAVAQSASVIQGQLGGVSGRLSAMSMMMDTASLKTNILIGSVMALGAVIIKGTSEAMHYEKTMRILGFATDDAAGSFKFASDMADKYAVSLKASVGEYAKFAAATKGTALEGKATTDMFESMTIASSALGLSADETSGAFKAFTQMVSKGNVQAEELRGQLGERLVGAFSMAAKSMGVTTSELNKMLELGQVAAEDLLPKMAVVMKDTFEDTALGAAGSFQGSLNRMENSWYALGKALSDAGFLDSLATAIGGAGAAIEYFAEAIDKINGIDRRSAFQKSLEETNTQLVELKNGIITTTDKSVTGKFGEVSSSLQGMSLASNNSAEGMKLLSASIQGVSQDGDSTVSTLNKTASSAKQVQEQLLSIKESGADGIFNDLMSMDGMDAAEARLITLAQMEADIIGKEYDKSQKDYYDHKLEKRVEKLSEFFKTSTAMADKHGQDEKAKENTIFAQRLAQTQDAYKKLLAEEEELNKRKAALVKSGENQYALKAVEQQLNDIQGVKIIAQETEAAQKEAHKRRLEAIEKKHSHRVLATNRDVQQKLVDMNNGTEDERINRLIALNDTELALLDEKKQKLIENGASEQEATALIDAMKIERAQQTADAISEIDNEAHNKRLRLMQDFHDQANTLSSDFASAASKNRMVDMNKATKDMISFAKTAEKVKKGEQGALLDIAGATAQLMSGLMESGSRRQFEIGKAASLASITINTAQAVMKTLGDGGMFAMPAAIAVGALGATNFMKVLNTKFESPTRPTAATVSASTSTVGGNSAPPPPSSTQQSAIQSTMNISLKVDGLTGNESPAVLQQITDMLAPAIADQIAAGGTNVSVV